MSARYLQLTILVFFVSIGGAAAQGASSVTVHDAQWSIMKDFVALILAAILGGAIALYIQPRIAKRSAIMQERWRAKKLLFEEAIALHDWMYNFNAQALGNTELCTYEPPHERDINRVAAGLLLLSEDEKIPKKFLSLVTKLDETERAKLLNLMRKELFNDTIDVKPGEIPIFHNKKPYCPSQ